MEDEVFSTLTDEVAVSYAKSVRYLLTQIEVRIDLEPAIYGQHNIDLREVLLEAAVMLERQVSTKDTAEIATFIQRELADIPATRIGDRLGVLLTEAAELRKVLVEVRKRIRAIAESSVSSELEQARLAVSTFVERDFVRETALYEGSTGKDAY